MKQSVKTGLILAAAALLTGLTIAANVVRSRSQVHGIDVDIRCNRTPQLVDAQAVTDSVLAALPHLYATRVRDVNRRQVAAAAIQVPYIEQATASVSVSGKVVIKARQRRPIARLFHGTHELYIDSHGALFPTSTMADCDVLVIGGDFTAPLTADSLDSQLADLLTVARFLDHNTEYAMLVDQLYSRRDGDIIMVSKLGNNIIELGSPENLDEKFSNLWTFYRKGMPRAGWGTYSKISLKYKGQVVCTKNNQ